MDEKIFDNLVNKIENGDIPENYQDIVELIGIEHTIELCKYACGDKIYFPVPETIVRNTRNREILKEYKINNVKELAEKYGVTMEQIKSIVRQAKT